MIRHPLNPPLFPYTTLFRSPSSSPAAWLVAARAWPASARPRPGGSAGSAGLRPGFPAPAPTTCAEPGSETCRSEEHTSELQSLRHLVCRLLLEKKKINHITN